MLGGHRPRRENVLEAQIQSGDTLQAIALRYNCTVGIPLFFFLYLYSIGMKVISIFINNGFRFSQISDIKRLNKIEKESEIHARNTLKVPMNAHTLLLSTGDIDALPIVHKSGQSSPKHVHPNSDDSSISNTSHNNHQLLPGDRLKLDEKLLIASVSLSASNGGAGSNQLATATITTNTSQPTTITNGLIAVRKYTDNETIEGRESFFNDPLLAHLDSGPHVIRGAPKNDLSCSGSDCDISWICLLICILALCFAIPLIYVIYIAEHPEKFNHTESA